MGQEHHVQARGWKRQRREVAQNSGLSEGTFICNGHTFCSEPLVWHTIGPQAIQFGNPQLQSMVAKYVDNHCIYLGLFPLQ